jgi:hypothetical protein
MSVKKVCLERQRGGPEITAITTTYLDLFVLHRVLDGTKENTFFGAVAHLELLGDLDHGITELVVDGFVDIDTLNGQADLTGVEERKSGDLLRR